MSVELACLLLALGNMSNRATRIQRNPDRTQRGVTLVEVTAALGFAVLVGAGGWLIWGTNQGQAERTSTEQAAKHILGAAQDWRYENTAGCPTLTQLKYEGYLERDAIESDAWGHRFRIRCTDDGFAVLSRGEDGAPSTDDDIAAVNRS